MRADKTTKFLLAAIAAALWANVLGTWLDPIPAQARVDELTAIELNVRHIDRTLNGIAEGLCRNAKLC
jgi:hypothetical protein